MSRDQVIETLSVRDQVANIIRRKIITGEYRCGEKISERALSESLGVSTTPVKEAIRGLVSEGLLTSVSRKGTYVSDMANQSLKQLNYIKSSLEGVAAYFAADAATAEERRGLEEILGRAQECIDARNIAGMRARNTEFHQAVRRASRNRYLIALLDNLYLMDLSVRASVPEEDMAEHLRAQGEHLAIARAVRDGEREEAERAMVRHMRRVFDDMFDHRE